MAFTHNSKVADREPDWGSVDKTKLPRIAFADTGVPDKVSTWRFPHHWVQNGGDPDENGRYTTGTLYLHRGGLNAAWAAAQGARSGEKADEAVIRHLQAHRRALGLDENRTESKAHESFVLKAEVDVQAAEGTAAPAGDVAFTCRAYSGSPMRIEGWAVPVVVDLNGIDVSTQQIPLLASHEATPDNVLGVTDAIDINEDGIVARGRLFTASERARQVLALWRAGYRWQLSIGGESEQVEFVDDGQEVTVNGRNIAGPVAVVRQARLREISCVVLGADAATQMQIAAAARKTEDKPMSEETKKSVEAVSIPSAAALEAELAEAHRVEELKDVATRFVAELKRDYGGEVPSTVLQRVVDLYKSAVQAGQHARDLEMTLLRERPAVQPHGGIIGIGGGGARVGDVLKAAAMLSLKLPERTILRECGEQALNAASKQFGEQIGLAELALQCAAHNGYSGRQRITASNWLDVARWGCGDITAGVTSVVSLGGILGAVANKVLAEMAAEPEWVAPVVAGRALHTTFHTYTVYSLGVSGELETVPAGGELKHLTVGEESYTRKLETLGAVLSISRTDFVNDDLGAFRRAVTILGRKALAAREKALFTLINSSGAGASHFTAARGNYLSGANSALSVVGLSAAVAAFRKLADAGGDYMGLTPSLLLVPAALEATARMLLAPGSTLVTSGGTSLDIRSNSNIYAGQFGGAPVVSPWLDAASDTAWYLFARPTAAPCYEIAYLSGQETPTVEYFGLDATANVLGMTWRVYWDIGVAAAEWRAGVKCAGE